MYTEIFQVIRDTPAFASIKIVFSYETNSKQQSVMEKEEMILWKQIYLFQSIIILPLLVQRA